MAAASSLLLDVLAAACVLVLPLELVACATAWPLSDVIAIMQAVTITRLLYFSIIIFRLLSTHKFMIGREAPTVVLMMPHGRYRIPLQANTDMKDPMFAINHDRHAPVQHSVANSVPPLLFTSNVCVTIFPSSFREFSYQEFAGQTGCEEQDCGGDQGGDDGVAVAAWPGMTLLKTATHLSRDLPFFPGFTQVYAQYQNPSSMFGNIHNVVGHSTSPSAKHHCEHRRIVGDQEHHSDVPE